MLNDPFTVTLQEWAEVFMRQSMRNFMRFSRQSGLSMSQLGALLHIHHESRIGVSDLGGHLGVTSAAASQMLERLVKQGLILRTEDPVDRRVKQLVITDKGELVIQESIQARQSWFDELSEILSADEKIQVIAALNILVDKTIQLEPIVEIEK
jgi:DNA-binding MarR family transcriptional regulator